MAPRVALFVTCVVDQLFPRAGLAMADVLERCGCSVDFPEDQTCCGQPAFNSGWQDVAREVARHFLKTFRSYDYLVAPSGSCVAMVAHHYRELFAGEAVALIEAETLANRVFEFSQFLTNVLKIEDTGSRFSHVVTYHDSCHSLRDLHIREGPRRLLQNVRGLELREMELAEECCGFGGTFSIKFPQVSGAMARTKLGSIEKTGAEFVTATDASCLMQMEGALRRAGSAVRTVHLAEILASR